MQDCIFCKIVRKEAPAHVIWENDAHIAFLSIFPNTPGFSVVITKEHCNSYVFANTDKIVSGIVLAAKQVALKIDRAFDDVGRTGMMFEGFGVDHLHAKLFPMHGTTGEEWKQRASDVNKFFTQYEGYISSHDYTRADDDELKRIADKIRSIT